MLTLLFDIDGTLMQTGGAGMGAIRETMNDLFGVDDVPPVKLAGRTDQGIMTDVFSSVGQDFEHHREAFNEGYWRRLPLFLEQSTGSLLPGVAVLLDTLRQQQDVQLGILTGNSEAAARIKLSHFEIEHFFDFGGFGDVHASRNDVAEVALGAAKSYLGDAFDKGKVCVIGDTLNDIVCARSIDANVVVVGNGSGCSEELLAAKPDRMLANLADCGDFSDWLRKNI